MLPAIVLSLLAGTAVAVEPASEQSPGFDTGVSSLFSIPRSSSKHLARDIRENEAYREDWVLELVLSVDTSLLGSSFCPT
jgi:hypothetical protein